MVAVDALAAATFEVRARRVRSAGGGLTAMADERRARIAFLAQHPSTQRLRRGRPRGGRRPRRRDERGGAAAGPARDGDDHDRGAVRRGRALPRAARVPPGRSVADGRAALCRGRRAGGVETPVARIAGAAAAILTGERVVLNLLQHLSGVATLTRRFVDAVAGTASRHRRHAEDDPGPPPAREVRGRHGRRREPSLRPRRRHPVKNNHVALGGGTAAVVRARPRARARRRSASRSSAGAPPRSTPRSRPAPTRSCSTTRRPPRRRP